MKKCTKCNETKPLSVFYKRVASRDGYQSRCKTCSAECQRSGQGRLYQSRYRKSEKGKAMQARYLGTEKGKATMAQGQARYEATEKGKEMRARLDARRRGAEGEGTFTAEHRRDLYKEQNFCCAICREQFPLSKLTNDHILPLSLGGTHTKANVQLVCRPCNSSKGDKMPEEFKSSLRSVVL